MARREKKKNKKLMELRSKKVEPKPQSPPREMKEENINQIMFEVYDEKKNEG